MVDKLSGFIVDNMSMISLAIALIVAVSAFIKFAFIDRPGRIREKDDEKKSIFDHVRSEMSAEGTRNKYYQIAYGLYYPDNHELHQKRDLIFQDGWFPCKSDGAGQFIEFYKLSDIRVELEGNEQEWLQSGNSHRKDTNHSILDVMPNSNVGYAENMNEQVLRKNSKEMTNRPIYRFMGFGCDTKTGQYVMKVSRSLYFRFFDTCEALYFEMAYWIHEKNMTDVSNFTHLKARGLCRNLFDCQNRHIGIGINTLLIIKNTNETDEKGKILKNRKNIFLMHHRKSSSEINEAVNTLHVVPAGTYQPNGMDFNNFDILDSHMENNIVREFVEELRNVAEFSDLADGRLIQTHPDARTILQRIHDDSSRWNLFFLGLGLDALNTKCEVLTCLVIDMLEPASLNVHKFNVNPEGDVLKVVFDEINLCQYINNPKTLPAARKILSIVLDHYDFFLK